MNTSPSQDQDAAIADLKAKWDDLHSLDRARRIQKIREKSGISVRALAKAIGRNESSLRHALKAAEAPVVDKLGARKGGISTRELVRRSKEAQAQQKAKDREALDRKRTKEAEKAATIICDWLEEEKRGSARGEAIIDETRRNLAESEWEGNLPKAAPPQEGTPVRAIIERMRPSKDINPDTESIAWYAAWLARWAFFAFPDDIVRDRALNIAWHAESKRP